MSKKIRVYDYRSVLGVQPEVDLHLPMITINCTNKIRCVIRAQGSWAGTFALGRHGRKRERVGGGKELAGLTG